jgi:hypothetical protein
MLDRHFVSVGYARSKIDHFNALRAKVSRAFAKESPFASSGSAASSQTPAECTNYLDAYAENSVSDLIDFPHYDDQAVSIKDF